MFCLEYAKYFLSSFVFISGFSTLFLCSSSMNFAILSSFVWSGRSLIGNIKSNLLISVGARFIWLAIVSYGSNLPNFGFAAASTVVSHLRLACMFALLIVTLCCSSASCIAQPSSFVILSISSMQHIPLFASTSAPASRLQPCRNSSFTTAALSPAPLAPFPVTYLPFGATNCILLSNCDFAAPGSPTRSMWMSPLVMIPSSLFFLTPPASWSASASLIFSWP